MNSKTETQRLWRLVEAVREAGTEWTVKMSAKDKQKVNEILKREEELLKQIQADYEEDDHDHDEDDHEECCRNCGHNSVVFQGCCSVRCAKDADEYD